MKHTKVKDLLNSTKTINEVNAKGWVRTFRNNQFIALNDGSTNQNLQVVVGLNQFDEALLKRITTSACIQVSGKLIASQGKGHQSQ